MKIWLERFAWPFSKYIMKSLFCYKLNDEAEDLYEEIFDKYNGQFNFKYSGSSEPCLSQSQLDYYEKLEINVRVKAPELIGRLTCVLWIYCNGMNNLLIK